MSNNKMDDRQVINTTALSELGNTANQTLDVIMNDINTFFADATSAPTASVLMERDANANVQANNFIPNSTSTATAAGTTTLTVASSNTQIFTGSTTQTVVLPVATTLTNGFSFYIVNNSTGVVTVQTSGSNTVQAMATNTYLAITCVNTAGGTGTTSWVWSYGNIDSTLPIANPMTTGGDIIYGGTSGLPTRLPNGSAGQVLTSGGTTVAPSWASPTATPQYAVTSKTSTYSIQTTDTVVICSGASFTLTLPTAVGVAGKVYIIVHNGNDFSQTYTLNTTSSQTVDGVASGQYILGTFKETVVLYSDGSNWLVQDHKTTYTWRSFTLTIGAATGAPTPGSGSTSSAVWRRVGTTMEILYRYNQTNAGSGGSGTYKFPIPGSGAISIDTSVVTPGTTNATNGGSTVGVSTSSNSTGASATTGVVFVYDSTNLAITNSTGSAASNTPIGSAEQGLGNTEAYYTFRASIPIASWQP